MRLLFFIERLSSGGKERRMLELIKKLQQQHPQLSLAVVIANRDVHYKEVYDLGIPVKFATRVFGKKDILPSIKLFWIALKFKPDIIHAWGPMVAVHSILASKLLNIPILNNQISNATLNTRVMGKGLSFRFSSRIVANTNAGLLAYDAPSHKSKVIYNGIDLKRFSDIKLPSEVKELVGITTPFTVAMVASNSMKKDYHTFLKAAVSIISERTDITFLCIGVDTEKLEEKIPEFCKGLIKPLGLISDVESIINVCDVGVLTSNITKHGEGISNALIEFMAIGKPVIATAFGGSLELISHDSNGFLVEPNNVEDLAARITFLINSSSTRKKMGYNALETIKTRFSMDRMVGEFYDLYHEINRNPNL